MYKFLQYCKYCKKYIINHILNAKNSYFKVKITLCEFNADDERIFRARVGKQRVKISRMPRAKFMRHGYSCPQPYESFPFLCASRMTKFAIEKCVSKHRTRELGRVLLKGILHTTPRTHPPPCWIRFSSDAAGPRIRQDPFPSRETLGPKYWSVRKICASSNMSRLLPTREETRSKQLNTLCRFEPAGSCMLQTFRVYVTCYTGRNLFFLSEMAKRV